MFRELYQWMQDIAFYLVLVTMALQVVPGTGYRKYVRFFTGLVLVMMILGPLFKLFGTEYDLDSISDDFRYEEELKEFEEKAEDMEAEWEQEAGLQGEGTERRREEIEVEEIQIH